MTNSTPIAVAVLGLELIPAVAFGFASERMQRMIASWPRWVRIVTPSLLVLPYLLLGATPYVVRLNWIFIYFLLPVVIAWLLERAALVDPEQRGNWRDAVILLILGLTVDLRWFDIAWPEGWRGLGNLLLVDAGLYGFLGVRRLSGTGFDFQLRWSDWKTGFRELLLLAPIVIVLGIAFGFIHPHKYVPALGTAILRWAMIFVFVAIPEELFFRAWVQNLLERRLGRWPAVLVASILFGLSHFNKRNPAGQHFNWHYVLLATIAGIFYGRAWREDRRVPASTITHTCVDWLWSWWF